MLNRTWHLNLFLTSLVFFLLLGEVLQSEIVIRQRAQRFELKDDGLALWIGSTCDSEVGGPGTLRTYTDRNNPNGSTLVNNSCGVMRGGWGDAAWRGSYLYYFYNRRLSREDAFFDNSAPQAIRNTSNNYTGVVPNNQDYSPVVLKGSDLYWAELQGNGSTQIRRSGNFGQQVAQTVTTVSGEVEKFIPFEYNPSVGVRQQAVVSLTTTGELWLYRLGARFALRLESGVRDVHVLERQTIAINGLLNATIYVAKGVRTFGQTLPPTGSVLRIDARTGDKTVIYTCTTGNQAISITTDPAPTQRLIGIETKQLYFTEGVVRCSGGLFRLCNIQRTRLHRHTLPGRADASWVMIREASRASHGNLRSDGEHVYYLEDEDGNGVQDSIGRISTTAPPFRFDIIADGIEVTQAIQTFDNEVELLAEREGTYVRAYARFSSSTNESSIFVTGRLRAFMNGREITGSPFNPIKNPRLTESVDLAPRRADIERTYLFRLPKLPTGTLRVEFEINHHRAYLENRNVDGEGLNPYANNTVSAQLPVRNSGEPCLQIVSPRLQGHRYTYRYNPRIHQLFDRALSLTPVKAFDDFPRTVDVPSIVNQKFMLIDLDDDEDVAADRTMDAYRTAIEEIAAIRECSDNPNQGCADDYWVIAVHPWVDTRKWGGLSWGRRVIVVKMNDRAFPWADKAWNWPGGGQTLAHELGHEYGRAHVDCGGPERPDPFYPYNECFIDDNISTYGYGFDPITRQAIRPEDAGDLMSYADFSWISDYNWLNILEEVRNRAGGSGGGGGLPDVESWLLVRGTVDLSTRDGSFNSFYLFDADDAPESRVQNSLELRSLAESQNPQVRLIFRGTGGNQLASIPLYVSQNQEADDQIGGFLQYVPFISQAEQIELRIAGRRADSRDISNSSPTIQLSPLEALDDGVLVNWQASDADGDELHFNIYLSLDNGNHWQSITLDHEGFGIAVSTTQFAATSNARIRVDATDGVLTSQAISESFVIEPHTPVVSISGLDGASNAPFGTTVYLRSVVVDPDPGPNGLTYEWSLDREGSPTANQVSESEDLILDNPQPGSYRAQVRVTDSSGRTGQASFDFTILPLLIEVLTEPNFDGLPNDSAYGAGESVQLTGSRATQVWLTRTQHELFISGSGLPNQAINSAPYITLVIDSDGDAGNSLDADDFGIRIYSTGRFEQLRVSGGNLVSTSSHPLVDALVKSGPSSWNFELRIPRELINNWNNSIHLMLGSFGTGGGTWPPNSTLSTPSTWGQVRFNEEDLPPSENRAPIAQAGEDEFINTDSAFDFTLDGGNSYDPDGDELIYRWIQLEGPEVDIDLDGPTSNFARTRIPKREGLTLYRFRLRVNDGEEIGSDEMNLYVYSIPSDGGSVGTGLFSRGNANNAGGYDISDCIFTLSYLFIGTEDPPCFKAADSNDDGQVDISDPLFTLSYLFIGTADPAAPFPGCGADLTPDNLTCLQFDDC